MLGDYYTFTAAIIGGILALCAYIVWREQLWK